MVDLDHNPGPVPQSDSSSTCLLTGGRSPCITVRSITSVGGQCHGCDVGRDGRPRPQPSPGGVVPQDTIRHTGQLLLVTDGRSISPVATRWMRLFISVPIVRSRSVGMHASPHEIILIAGRYVRSIDCSPVCVAAVSGIMFVIVGKLSGCLFHWIVTHAELLTTCSMLWDSIWFLCLLP